MIVSRNGTNLWITKEAMQFLWITKEITKKIRYSLLSICFFCWPNGMVLARPSGYMSKEDIGLLKGDQVERKHGRKMGKFFWFSWLACLLFGLVYVIAEMVAIISEPNPSTL